MSYANENVNEHANENAHVLQREHHAGREQAFEHLPFAGAETLEMESERGARRFQPRPRRMLPTPLARAHQHAYPRARPRWTPPYYGSGWGTLLSVPEPFGALLPEPLSALFSGPFSEPFSEPLSEPFSNSVGFGDGAPGEGETPAVLGGTLSRLSVAQRPAYHALGTIAAAIANPRSTGPGLYLIEFTSDGRRRAYSGQSGNVRTRLLQHQLCARMLGLSLDQHQVYVAALPALSPQQRRALEHRIHSDMLARQRGVLTNQRRELEVQLLGAEWQ